MLDKLISAKEELEQKRAEKSKEVLSEDAKAEVIAELQAKFDSSKEAEIYKLDIKIDTVVELIEEYSSQEECPNAQAIPSVVEKK